MEFENKPLLVCPSRIPKSICKRFEVPITSHQNMVLGQHAEYIILLHLSHPTLVGGLKNDESDGEYHLKA